MDNTDPIDHNFAKLNLNKTRKKKKKEREIKNQSTLVDSFNYSRMDQLIKDVF